MSICYLYWVVPWWETGSSRLVTLWTTLYNPINSAPNICLYISVLENALSLRCIAIVSRGQSSVRSILNRLIWPHLLCWLPVELKGNQAWNFLFSFFLFFFFQAFCIYKPQICCWKLDHFLPSCEIRQSSRVKPRSAGGAGTVLTLPLAPVGGHQHCWLNKQGRHPVQATASDGDWNKSATCST